MTRFKVAVEKERENEVKEASEKVERKRESENKALCLSHFLARLAIELSFFLPPKACFCTLSVLASSERILASL